MKRFNTLFVLLSLFSFSFVSADDIFDDDGFDDFGSDFAEENMPFGKESKPYLSLRYGLAAPSIHKDFLNTDMAMIGTAEVRLGEIRFKELKIDSAVLLTGDAMYVNLGYYGKSFYDAGSENEIICKGWKFGLGGHDGLGYKLGEKANLMFNNGSGIFWTKPGFSDVPAFADASDLEQLMPYDDDFRFGVEHESAISFRPLSFMDIDFSYTRSMVYPRVMFWYMAGSGIVEGIGGGLLNMFNKKIMKSSPYAAPIVGFILQTAYSYGFSKLREKQMNFPFGGDTPPLILDQFRVSVTANF